MTTIDAKELDFTKLNDLIRDTEGDVEITNCLGQRFIADGQSGRTVTIQGVPGNALGAYLNGADIIVNGNAQDAVGDTMNDGKIIIHGNTGDAVGYAMRGGAIYVQGNAGYRAGIHMKAYKEKVPALIIGGGAGSFLGEYQAGGIIIVLGLTDKKIVGNFPGTGMHGGKMILRSNCKDIRFNPGVHVAPATKEDLEAVHPYMEEYCKQFDYDLEKLMDADFTIVTPDSSNPYKQMYVAN